VTGLLLLFVLFVSHGAFLVPFVQSIRRKRIPSTLEFSSLSFLLYYDVGIATEAFGIPFENDYFPGLLRASEPVQLEVALILAIAPWLIKLGYKLAGGYQPIARPASMLKPARSRLFYGTSFLAAAIIAGSSAAALFTLKYVWTARAVVGAFLGPYILVLFLPLNIFAFYVMQRDARTTKGRWLTAILGVLSAICVIPLGERTLLLLPFLIVFLFYGELTSTRLVVALFAGVLAAGVLLPMYKWQNAKENSISSLAATISSDFARGPILADVLERSPAFGTKIMKYPGEGYTYSLFFFVPRQLAPFKGEATARRYSAAVLNTPASELSWGFGISAIDELIINFGIVFFLPALIVWGVLMRCADIWSETNIALLVAMRLSAVWFLGYQLPSALQNFGAMALTGLVLQFLFAQSTKRVRLKEVMMKAEAF
jgi:hypothetical protein